MPEGNTAICLARLRTGPAFLSSSSSSSFLYTSAAPHTPTTAGCTQAAHPEDCGTHIKNEPAIDTEKYLFHLSNKCALLSNNRKDKPPERQLIQACYSGYFNLCRFHLILEKIISQNPPIFSF